MNTGKKQHKKIDKQKINILVETVNFRDIEEAELNAQEMNAKDFNRLVKNIKRDGSLTSTPLIMRQNGKSKYRCISGHHRIKAAIMAGILASPCMIMDEVDESTRIRLQLAHNDIHGNPNENTVQILQQKLNDIDLTLIEQQNIDEKIEELVEVEYTPPQFRYINICLLEESRNSLVDMIMSLDSKSNDVNWLIEKEQYESVADLLTLAFEKGFKTPGQAFGKFLEIIQENKELIKR